MDVALTVLYTDSKTVTSSKHNYTYTVTMNVCDDNVGCNEVKNVMLHYHPDLVCILF